MASCQAPPECSRAADRNKGFATSPTKQYGLPERSRSCSTVRMFHSISRPSCVTSTGSQNSKVLVWPSSHSPLTRMRQAFYPCCLAMLPQSYSPSFRPRAEAIRPRTCRRLRHLGDQERSRAGSIAGFRASCCTCVGKQSLDARYWVTLSRRRIARTSRRDA